MDERIDKAGRGALRLGYVARYDVTRPSTWHRNETGLAQAGASIVEGLARRGHEVVPIGPLRRIKNPAGKLAASVRKRWCRLVNRQIYYYWTEPVELRGYGRQVARLLAQRNRGKPLDALLTAENAIALSKYEGPERLIFWLDSSFAGLLEFYPDMTNLCRRTRSQLVALEAEAFQKAEKILFTSDWAAEIARKQYGIPDRKLGVLGWGPNIRCDRQVEDVEKALAERPRETCRLLFMGVDWKRKGGDVAVAVAERLSAMGQKCELTIVGCVPPPSIKYSLSYVKVIPFVDKNSHEGATVMADLLRRNHFLILPSRADCLAVSLVEAMSYGVVCLTSDVGGAKTFFASGDGGRTFPLEHGSDPYVEEARRLMLDRPAYEGLALAAFRRFDRELRWERLIEKFEAHVAAAISR